MAQLLTTIGGREDRLLRRRNRFALNIRVIAGEVIYSFPCVLPGGRTPTRHNRKLGPRTEMRRSLKSLFLELQPHGMR